MSGAELTYRVLFERRGAGHEVYCQAEIQDGLWRLWMAADTGTTPERALKKCLQSTQRALGVGLNGDSICA